MLSSTAFGRGTWSTKVSHPSPNPNPDPDPNPNPNPNTNLCPQPVVAHRGHEERSRAQPRQAIGDVARDTARRHLEVAGGGGAREQRGALVRHAQQVDHRAAHHHHSRRAARGSGAGFASPLVAWLRRTVRGDGRLEGMPALRLRVDPKLGAAGEGQQRQRGAG